MRRTGAFFLFALVSIPRAAWPQGDPLGLEFQINTYTTGSQGFSGSRSVASDQSGNFVVVWTSPQDGSLGGVFGQRYASSGRPLGPEFRVNTYTTDNQNYPSVASDASGNFVVVWSSDEQDGSNHGVFGQRYASSGAPDGPEFRINTYTTGTQYVGSVAADAAGNFIVVWTGTSDVFGQRYDSSGTPLGPEFRVNTYTTNFQVSPSVASDQSGNFVVVWRSFELQGPFPVPFSLGIFGQRYASSGAPLGPEFRVNTYTTTQPGFFRQIPSVASDASGNFDVVWGSFQDGSPDVFGQRYDSSGTPLGPEFRVNTYTTDNQNYPSVASDASGNFVVVWSSDEQDGSNYGGFAQRYASSGAPDGPEFRVNTYTTGTQFVRSVAADAAGNFVVVWESDQPGDPDGGVFGQRYGRIVPVELMRLTVE